MKTSTLALLVAVALAGCAAVPGTDQGGSSVYAWQGQPGAAAAHFGGQDQAVNAFRGDEAGCEYEAAKGSYSAPVPFAGGETVNAYGNALVAQNRGARLFDLCMAARGWRRPGR